MPSHKPSTHKPPAVTKPARARRLTPADYLKKILTARVYDVAHESALDAAPILSKRLHNQVLLKREDQQPVFSFKLRGAYNKMVQLSPAQLAKGVVCASAGNHAQGVALGAKKLGTRAVIVMPVTTPALKVDAVKALGGDWPEPPLLASVLRQQPAIGGIEARHGRRLVIGQLLMVGQPVAEMPEQARHGSRPHDQGGRGEGQQDFEQIEHGHLLRGAFHGSNGENGRDLCLSCGAGRRKMGINRAPERPCQRDLVLPNGQELLVLGMGEIAQFDQRRRDVRRGQHGKTRLPVGARQQADAVAPETLHDGVGEGNLIELGAHDVGGAKRG